VRFHLARLILLAHMIPSREHVAEMVGDVEYDVKVEDFEQPDPGYLAWLMEESRDEPPEPEDNLMDPAELQAILVRSMSPAELDHLSALMQKADRQRRKLQMLEARRASRHLATGRTQRCRRQARPRARSRRAVALRRAQPGSRAGEEPGPHHGSEPVITASPARACWKVGCDLTSGSVRGWS